MIIEQTSRKIGRCGNNIESQQPNNVPNDRTQVRVWLVSDTEGFSKAEGREERGGSIRKPKR